VSSATIQPSTQQPEPANLPDLLSFEAFMVWAMQTDLRAEWAVGEVQLMSPASIEHQRLVGFLFALIDHVVRTHGLGDVFFAPVILRLASRPSGREPDLIFVATAHAERVKDTYIEGPADLVIEVVSPESDLRDRGEKFLEYEADRIPEYWLIDAVRQAAHFFRLGDDSRYHTVELVEATYTTPLLPGLRLRPAWLWERPLPRVDLLLAETG
jgi:Uma2 family endonuclease